jgi:Arc/MetJ-type ribon-helix-helix transcriptional regulator
MSTLNIKIPDDMDEDLNEYVEETGQYMNKSELVRDAIRTHFRQHPITLSEQTLRDIRTSEKQIEEGRTVSLDDLE